MAFLGECHAGTYDRAHGRGYLGLSGCAGHPPVLHQGVRSPLSPPGAARLAPAEP